VVVYSCHPSYAESINRKIEVQAARTEIRDPTPKIAKHKELEEWFKW
jgi:hypothetical protein